MSGSDHPRAGRLTALTALFVSAALFMTALFGIASIDPGSGAAAPGGGGPSIHNITIDQKRGDRHDRRDCPFRDKDRQRDDRPAQDGVRS
jgi:hypothetical protein